MSLMSLKISYFIKRDCKKHESNILCDIEHCFMKIILKKSLQIWEKLMTS